MTRLEDWWSVLRAYLQFGETSYPVKFATRSGTQLQLDSFDELVTAWVVFCRDEYSIPTDARVVLDIGANYGAFSLLAAQMAPASAIYSLEPFPVTFAKLQANIESNGLTERVTCLQMAVSPQTGSASMNSDPEIGSHLRTLGSVSPEVTPSNNWVDVPTISLSELIEEVVRKEGVEFIDIVKMDIEGGEHDTLAAVRPELLARVLRWQMEYHPNGPRGPLFTTLERAGLHCVHDIRLGPDYGVAHFAR